jgi:tellurite resistance protein TerC
MLGAYTPAHFILFLAGVVLCLAADLRAHKADVPVSLRNAAFWSLFWVVLSLLFALYVGLSHGSGHAFLFLSGYLLEKSLSVDNLFVMMAIFSSFAVKDAFQHRVLYYGIVGALLLRMIFIALGSSLVVLFGSYALAAFGLFVLWSAWKMWRNMGSEDKEIEDYSRHWAVSFTRRFLPVHNFLQGHDFFLKVREGPREVWKATPLFLCLVAVEFSDIMFAFDSVPAVIAITQDPFLVYTSNIFAILGLRSLYFLLAAAKRCLRHLEKSVIVILVYIGLKMLLDVTGLIHLPPLVNLAVVLGLLAAGIAASLIRRGEGNGGADSHTGG